MTAYPLPGLVDVEVLLEDGGRILCRGRRDDADHPQDAVLAIALTSDHPAPALVDRLIREFELQDELGCRSVVRPRALVRENGRTVLLLDDPGGQPLDRQLGQPMELGSFLQLAIGLSAALGEIHDRGIIHKDIKPANVLVNPATKQIWLTGFGIASRLPRERQAPSPPEVIAGTLAYMAPEQTGRMNRSIDARSDLYALGVTLYQMLTGALPFTASAPLEWVHCHIARKPAPPSARLTALPAPISQIIMKLLAKTAEERYQTAAGLERDLRRCLSEWDSQDRIDQFSLGEHDIPDRLLIPEKLYGRQREVAALLASFDRIVGGGVPELVLVSGYSGIGKSSVVNELHKVLVPPRGLLGAGKFDQHKRDIPYATLAQAFQNLTRPLLSKSEKELGKWREALHEALGPNGRLIVNLVPDLQLIIGETAPVPDLPPQDAQRRFKLVFRRFIGVFARPEHPLALFLDDLQWLDSATLGLIEDLLTQADMRHLMLIGAYRDNEVGSSHPLARKLDAIRKSGAPVQEINLAPLRHEDLAGLIEDALRCEAERGAALADLVYEKTEGNPFFAIQFIGSLVEEDLLTFDYGAGRWSWDLDRIRAKGHTDNVVDLMVGKLHRLPVETQQALQLLACMGNSAGLDLLELVSEHSSEEMHRRLWDALRAGLILRTDQTYAFLHDRVQEAAYSLIPENLRAETHLRIGNLLAERITPEKREEAAFEIVNQLNRGSNLITSDEQRKRLAALNLMAGKRAKSSTAYASALSYLAAARALLTERSWDEDYELIFSVECDTAECELLTANMTSAENRLLMLAQHTKRAHDIAVVTRLRIALYTTLALTDRAVEVGVEQLRRFGIEWSTRPGEVDVRAEYDGLCQRVGERPIEALADLPAMKDPDLLALMEILHAILPPTALTDKHLCDLIALRMANLSLDHGYSDGSPQAFVELSRVIGPRFGRHRDGLRFGHLGAALAERDEFARFRGKVYCVAGYHVLPWTHPIQAASSMMQRGLDLAEEASDLLFAGFCQVHLISLGLASGARLDDLEAEAERNLESTRRAKFGLMSDMLTAQVAFMRTLRGVTPSFGCLDDGRLDELQMEQHLLNPALDLAAWWYWIRKMQARYLAGDHAAAADAFSHAQLWRPRSYWDTAESCFYGALSCAAFWDFAPSDRKQQYFEALIAQHRQLDVWAQDCPETFESRAALVAAEIARIEGREFDAMRYYEQAIRAARDNGFVQNEAIANELAARFCAARGLETSALAHLRNARQGYLRWGADGKVRQLDELHPHLGERQPALAPTSTIGASVEYLDLATVVKVSQAISSEIVLQKLIDTLMRTAIEQAGAERGLLIVPHGAEPRIEAEAASDSGTVIVHLRDQPVTAIALPESVLHYVLRSHASVILGDAAADPSSANDPYVRQRQARSVLCLPLVTQTKLIGVLYLENNLAPHVFAPARIAVLKLLASQAAISLENSRLYSDLQEREAKIRRLVDANIIGIFIWDFEGRIIEANDTFLGMVGYDREDLLGHRMRWTELTPSEWREHDPKFVAEVKSTGTARPHEKEYLRKDGSRVPVLIGSATFEQAGNQGVAFVLDLTERKLVEAEARENERRYREVQIELAHANRVATMGQLTASIAHEVKQPIGAAVLHAEAARRWLDRRPPNLDEVRELLAMIARDGHRASTIIDRIRGLVRNAPPRIEKLEIGEAIREVIELTRGEAVKNGVSVQTQFAERLPIVHADRTQIQQVILNLIMNAVQASGGCGLTSCDVSISTSANGSDGVLVSVRDSGPGIPLENVKRLFDPFYTTKSAGMGMGLAICRSIVEGYGGQIWATANLPRGAAFHFTLPADRATVAEQHSNRSEPV
ncbi:ATP-binding sensor histidine kinase [Bradyrhizobium sp. Arg816]|uniref:trifunctional serine/threonine-protein kinase/ATP-binding protein/sensor histidine kinase n=1 Tax=Bradyrhizobium sp. Arg816 TaxID=2998491 RepID=UPI00249E3808|nr:ATP-binding sensor histidine kinase [Bradyrhizobium sp. Arg816]MDI3561904.1 AAA family ATPase [Bradyrhizobium sp. Arg816]